MRGLKRGILITVLMMASGAQAGESLLLKTGTIDAKTAAHSQVFFSQAQNNTSYYIVQFKSPIRLQDQNWLKSQNIDILRYIPEDAYVVRLNDLKALKALNKSELLNSVLPYQAQFRLNHEAVTASVFNERKLERLHVRSFKGVSADQFKTDLLKISGLQILEASNGAYIVAAPMGRAQQLAAVEGVEWVDLHHEFQMQGNKLNQLFQNNDGLLDIALEEGSLSELTGYETGTRLMSFSSAWKKGLAGKGQTVAVADTGLDTGDIATLSKDFSNLVRPFIGGIESESWGDPNGHGTHVAGSVLNSGESSNGQIRGGAYEAELIMEAMWSEKYGNITIGPDPSPLFQVAYEEGARIHSNSWGSIVDHGAYNDSARAVDEFMFENPDMLVLFSAGNEGVDGNADGRVDGGSVTSPSTAKNALTVGASENLVDVGGVQVELGKVGTEKNGFLWPVDPIASDTLSNNPNGIAAFSSRGPTQDGRRKPDVVAPGTNILSNCSKFPEAGKLWGPFNEDFCYSGGTSMSTPLVAAAAAIVRQDLIENRGHKAPSAALIKGILMHTAIDLYPGQYGEVGKENGQELLKPGPNNNQGFGRVNVAAAIQNMGLIDEKKGLATGEKKTYALPSGARKVTLVYTDAPGSTAAEKALVNDLNIEIHTTGGRFFSSRSRINNTEQVLIPEGAQKLKLVVKGKNIPMGQDGRQPFSVIYSK